MRFRNLLAFTHPLDILPARFSQCLFCHSKYKQYPILKCELQVLGKGEACFKYVSPMAYKLFVVRAASSATCNVRSIFQLERIIEKSTLKHTTILLI